MIYLLLFLFIDLFIRLTIFVLEHDDELTIEGKEKKHGKD